MFLLQISLKLDLLIKLLIVDYTDLESVFITDPEVYRGYLDVPSYVYQVYS